jgi:hypothetical protein
MSEVRDLSKSSHFFGVPTIYWIVLVVVLVFYGGVFVLLNGARNDRHKELMRSRKGRKAD